MKLSVSSNETKKTNETTDTFKDMIKYRKLS